VDDEVDAVDDVEIFAGNLGLWFIIYVHISAFSFSQWILPGAAD
jgi:hypothetical protein